MKLNGQETSLSSSNGAHPFSSDRRDGLMHDVSIQDIVGTLEASRRAGGATMKDDHSLLQDNSCSMRRKTVSFTADATCRSGASSSTARRRPTAYMSSRRSNSSSSSADMDSSMDASWGGGGRLRMKYDDGEDDSTTEETAGSDSENQMEESLRIFQERISQSSDPSLQVLDGHSSRTNNNQSFNASFARIGNMDRSRGSLFVWDDEKLAQTKVVKTRINKSARKIQKFFRQSMVVLTNFQKEKAYLVDELEDIEGRRQEELARVSEFITEEKDRIRMELEREFNEEFLTPEQWDEFEHEKATTKEEIETLKADNKQMKKEMKRLKKENKQLSIQNPEKESERAELEEKVNALEQDKTDWEAVLDKFSQACKDAEDKIDLLLENRREKRRQRKKMDKCIRKIAEFMEENQQEDNPKLVKKVLKLQRKLEKQIEELKESTVCSIEGEQVEQYDGQPQDGKEGRQPQRSLEELELLKEQKRKKKEKRKSKMPEMASSAVSDKDFSESAEAEPSESSMTSELDAALTEEEQALKEEKRRKKKEKRQSKMLEILQSEFDRKPIPKLSSVRELLEPEPSDENPFLSIIAT